MVRTLLRKVATPPHHGHDFRKRKLPLATAPSCAVSRSKHFATQNGLLSKFCYAKPPTASAVFAVFDRPVFLRGAYFAVHWSKHFAMQNGLLSKFCYAKPPIQNFASQSGLRPPHHIQNFASQSGLRPPHLSLRFTGQSILLRKTVYCQNFATQNRLQRQRSSLFLTAPFSSGCILCGS